MLRPKAARTIEHLCARVVEATAGLGVTLDYSVESLHSLDELVETLRQECIPYEECSEALFMYGLYLGEVIRRHFGGTWRQREETPVATRAPMLVETRLGFANPIVAVMKRFERGEDDSLLLFFHNTFRARVRARGSGEVRTAVAPPAMIRRRDDTSD